MVQVTLDGLILDGRVLRQGAKIQLSDLAEHLQEQVQGDAHPFLELVKTHRVERPFPS